MVGNVASYVGQEQGDYCDDDLEVQVAGRTVVVEPDRMVVRGGHVLVQRIRTGRQTASEDEKPVYTLLKMGARVRFPEASVAVEAYYPNDGEAVPINGQNEAKALRTYSDAIAGIEAGAFSARPADPRYCPNCQCYFICGA